MTQSQDDSMILDQFTTLSSGRHDMAHWNPSHENLKMEPFCQCFFPISAPYHSWSSMIKYQFIPFYLGDMLASTDFQTSPHLITSFDLASLCADCNSSQGGFVAPRCGQSWTLGRHRDQWSMRPPKNKKPQHTYWFTWIDILYTELRPSFLYLLQIYTSI